MKYNLDKLKKVELRDVWLHEALDFTRWLSEEPNLAILSSAVGIELELIETESSVGSFNVDIYAREAGTGRKVIIENQLEDTNHDHLGKVITYAAGKGARRAQAGDRVAQPAHRQRFRVLSGGDRAVVHRGLTARPALQRCRAAERVDEGHQAQRGPLRDRARQAIVLDQVSRGGPGVT